MSDETSAGNPKRRESRARVEIGRIALRICGFYAVFVGVQWGLILLGVFGDKPVIPGAFFACTNGLFAIVTIPLAAGGILSQLRPFRFDWRGWLALALTVGAIYGAVAQALAVLVRH